MSWAQYVDKLKGPDDDGDVNIGEAAIVGYASGAESVWAASPALTGITPAEIKTLVGSDRMGFYSTGLVLGGMRCTVIRDLLLDKPFTMDLKTKATETDKSTYSVTIAKSNKALVVVKGLKDVPGGKLNDRAFKMANYLRDLNF